MENIEQREFKLNDISLVVIYKVSHTDAIDRYISEIVKVYLRIGKAYINITHSIKDWRVIWSVLDGKTK